MIDINSAIGGVLTQLESPVQPVKPDLSYAQLADRSQRLTEKLWDKMAVLYGHKFASQFGSMPCPDWAHVLIGITGRQMADGLNACLRDYPEWPPGAAQFRALCLGLNPRNIDPDGNDATWQIKKIEAANRRYDEEQKQKRLLIADASAVEQNKKIAAAELSSLKNLFGTQRSIEND